MNLTRLHEIDDAPAIIIGGRTLSYADVRRASGVLAARLDGVSRVAVWAEPAPETAVALAGLVEAGVEVVPLNPKLGSAELGHILTDARPEAVIGADAGGLPRLDVDLDADLEAGRDSHADLVRRSRDPEDVALVIYTSGTTGRPKGVLIPRRAIATNLDALADAWAWTAADRVAHALPLFHVHGLILGLIGPLRLGGHLHHFGRFTPEAAASALSAGASMLFAVPTIYHRLADAAETDPAVAAALQRARLLVSGSAPLPARTFTRIERATGRRIVERYGLTETIMNTAVRADGERRPGEVGRPLPGVDLRVVTDDGSDAPLDGTTIGEVVVRGPNLFRGYLNRPEATAEVMRDGWFWTGDLATRAPDGYVRIIGRKSTDLIKTGGYKVGTGEIEAALLDHPAIRDVAVTGEPDEDLGERIVAWIVVEPGATPPSEQEVADHVAALLAPHKRPRSVRVLDDLPRNAMGKVVKPRLTASS
jgi:malonyl-CoA/methylmalonyl-CoA synthetase